jgi:hypothetical protein
MKRRLRRINAMACLSIAVTNPALSGWDITWTGGGALCDGSPRWQEGTCPRPAGEEGSCSRANGQRTVEVARRIGA